MSENAAFQSRVKEWSLQCFGPVIPLDKTERCDRFLEEALELVQSIGYSPGRAHALTDYVFNRPVGDPAQETGGVMVTVAALCAFNDLDMVACGEAELARVWEKINQIRAKQAAKPTGSALPVAVAVDQAAQKADIHPDDLAVDKFAAVMKAKLAQKRKQGRGGWDNPEECTIEFLSELLRDHVGKGDPVDVASFAMMIHQRGAAITADAAGQQRAAVFTGTVDSDSPLEAAAREAGWALTQLIDLAAWCKRGHISRIIDALAAALMTPQAQTERDLLTRLIKWNTDYPVNCHNGYAGLKALDAIIADAKTALAAGEA